MSKKKRKAQRQTKRKATNAHTEKLRALRVLDDLELLARYLFQLDKRNYDSIARHRLNLAAGRTSAEDVIAHMDPLRRDLLKRSKCTANLNKLREELRAIPAEWPGVYIPLWQIEQDFPGFRDIIPTEAPVHALFYVLARGKYDVGGKPEVWVAEAAMYEDMCMAVNELCALDPVDADTPVVGHKRRSWLTRSVMVTAFLFVEAYLNGIGIDCLITRWDELPESQRGLLAEFDFSRGVERWVKFRDKLLKFPRLAVGKEHPVLQENNDDDIAAFLGEFRELRDAIVHPSHRMYERGGLSGARVHRLMNVSRDEETGLRCADTAVRLVRKLHAAMERKPDGLSWLVDRDRESGLFPNRAFE